MVKQTAGRDSMGGFAPKYAEINDDVLFGEVWTEENVSDEDAKAKYQKQLFFPIGQPNDAFAQYFSGQSYLAPLSDLQTGIFNVTFEPGCRNNWHTHHAYLKHTGCFYHQSAGYGRRL